MGQTAQSLQQALNSSAAYVRLFAQAFPAASGRPIQIKQVAEALAAFEGTLVSLNSRYDRYAHGDSTALAASEVKGLALFRSFVMRCSLCHTPPLFTNGELAAIGAPDPPGVAFDVGAAEAMQDQNYNGAFRIPTLRNVALTAPYMHSGGLKTLTDVIDFYNAPKGHAIPPGQHVNLHWHMHLTAKALTAEESRELVEFLGSLTDETLMPEIPKNVPSGLPVVPRLNQQSAAVTAGLVRE
jgi:cytochrome c peroxidase